MSKRHNPVSPSSPFTFPRPYAGGGIKGGGRIPLLMAALLLFMPLTPRAADYVHAPAGCDFRIDFPEAPATGERCNPENPKDCYAVFTFNKIFAIDSGISVTATCNKAEKGMLQRYSGEVMQYTLETMAKNNATEYETGFADHGDAKAATLLGSRSMPDGTDKIYMAQLWISENSVLTIQAEITGPQTPETDTMFVGIMKSIRLAAWDSQTPEKEGKKEDQKDGEEDSGNDEKPAAEQEE